LQRLDAIELGDAASVSKLTQHSSVAMKDAFVSSVSDFYLTNPIARASAVMAECSALAKGRLRQAAE
jgi:NADH-quinone oxidoreductase subunit G